MGTNIIVVILVGLIGFLIGYMYLQIKKRNKKKLEIKQEPIKQLTPAELTPTKLTPKVLPENRGRVAAKPIICPECINDKIMSDNSDVIEGEEIEEKQVLVFDSWIPYAAHIFQKHPNSPRVSWAICCVKDEINKFKEEQKELPESINILLQLIKSHGREPIVDVGVPYNMSPLAESSNGKQRIQVVDDWEERLGEIENLKKEDLIPPVEVKNPEPTEEPIDWKQYMS